MTILHPKTNIVADFTGTATVYNSQGSSTTIAATDLVRPSDWNSAHVINYSLGGNTAGSQSVSGLNVAFFGGNNITVSANTANSRIEFSGPNTTQFLTTAALSNHSHNFATTTTGGSQIVVGTTNSNGATIGVPPFITTFAGQTTQTQPAGNIAGVGTTFGGTNVSASVTLNSNGLNLALSAPSPGGGAVNFSAGTTSGNLQTVVFSNANGVSFGLAGSTITASAAGGGGGQATIRDYELFQQNAGSTYSTMGANTLYFQRFVAPVNISFASLERYASISTVSSTNSQIAAHTYDYGLYEAGTGASSTSYSLLSSSRMFFQASYNSNLSAGWTVSQGTSSVTNTSAGTVNLSALTGQKHIYMPFVASVSAGGNYAIGMRMSSATTGNTGPLRIGLVEQTMFSNLSIGRLDVSAGFSISAASRVGDFAQGVLSVTSSALPTTVALSQITNAVSQARMYVLFKG